MATAAYTVFARKYRPQTFADVCGQKAIAETVQNAIRAGRVAHAYLFAGPRGVGKTSMARILAKALNCHAPRDGEPCNECPSCVDITAGRHFDVDEFDAASNRKVEDAEALIQRVPQRAMRGDTKFRVFIVDEVHMMTVHAFNALLKTLEEPPPHVKFVFATTEPEELPDTILSRCQRFDFRRVGREDVVERLSEIAQREGIRAETGALRVIVKRAKGGMRDALMLLDQAVALCGSEIDERALRRALGVAPRERVEGILQAIAAGDAPAVLDGVAAAYGDGVAAGELLTQLADLAREVMVVAACGGPERAANVLEDADAAREVAPLAARLGTDRAIHVLAQAAEAERRLQEVRDERILVELTLVKLARMGDLLPLAEALERLRRLEQAGVGAAPQGSPPAGVATTGLVATPRPVSAAPGSAPTAPASPPAASPPPPPAVAPPAASTPPAAGTPPAPARAAVPESRSEPQPAPAAVVASRPAPAQTPGRPSPASTVPPAAPAAPAAPSPAPAAPSAALASPAPAPATPRATSPAPLPGPAPRPGSGPASPAALPGPATRPATGSGPASPGASATSAPAAGAATPSAAAPGGPAGGALLPLEARGPGGKKRRTHKEVQEDPDVKKVIEHMRPGATLVSFEDAIPPPDPD